MYRAQFTCFAGCPVYFDLDEVIYRCPNCNALLDVEHQLEPLKSEPASEWKNRFDNRWMKTKWPVLAKTA